MGGAHDAHHKAHHVLEKIPLKLIMNLITTVFTLLVIGVIIWGFFEEGFSDALRTIVSIYLFVAVCVIVMASFPVTKIRAMYLRWFLFLSSYNGKGVFLLLMGLLTTGLNLFGIFVGIANMLLGIVHILLWIFFRSLVTDNIGSVRLDGTDTEVGFDGSTNQDSVAPPAQPEYTPYTTQSTTSGMGGGAYGTSGFGTQAPPQYQVAQAYNNDGLVVVDGQEQYHKPQPHYTYTDEDDYDESASKYSQI
eukprot:TRINITY_DN3475_c0_g1_i1.p1 TRINITY_DN3475_c0_g1~~TRINITY_DN3475_c0_g1_i1.p1  ORF type:complete len:248 (-),score=41.35 TRINITY_DN3475_c0_g1_i1:54-797(-)